MPFIAGVEIKTIFHNSHDPPEEAQGILPIEANGREYDLVIRACKLLFDAFLMVGNPVSGLDHKKCSGMHC